MTDTTVHPEPVPGHLFWQVSRLPIDGQKRRKTLLLIAAFADAGQDSPTLDELSRRLDLDGRKVGALIGRLASDGYLARHRHGKQVRYELTLPGSEPAR